MDIAKLTLVLGGGLIGDLQKLNILGLRVSGFRFFVKV